MTADHRMRSDPIGRLLHVLCDVCAVIGGAVLIAMAAMTVVSVIGRTFFDSPILGDVELVQLGLAGVAAVKAQKGERVFVLGVLGPAQQLHAEHLGVEVDRALEVAHAQHGVQDSHAAIMACRRRPLDDSLRLPS